MATTTYRVKGMSCDHCVRAVTEEVARIDGVTDVEVDLGSGAVTVSSQRDLDDSLVRAAVDEAGYEVVG
jgi:copper chaperone